MSRNRYIHGGNDGPRVAEIKKFPCHSQECNIAAIITVDG